MTSVPLTSFGLQKFLSASIVPLCSMVWSPPLMVSFTLSGTEKMRPSS